MKKIGLALGSGGARGWAHVGVIEALQEANLQIDFVAGTSMGALVGAAFAAGQLDLLREASLRLDWKQVLYYFLEVGFPRSGLVDGSKIVTFLRHHIGRTAIESLRLPYAAVATDVLTGKEVVMRSGDLLDAIRASISIPGIFTPVRRGPATLVDGGVVNPLPVSVLREMGADFVIAVDVNYGAVGTGRKKELKAVRRIHIPAQKNRLLQRISDQVDRFDSSVLSPARRWLAGGDLPNIFDVIGNSVIIMQARITEMRLEIEPADLLIRPGGDVGYMEFHRAAEAIQMGYMAAKEALKSMPSPDRLFRR